jgi:Terpene cyclase DEP1
MTDRSSGRSTGPWNGRAAAYLVLAVVGLIGTWTCNVAAIAAHRDYIGDWIGSGPAVLSLTIDVLVAAVASAVFMVIESRRIGMRRVWIYIVLIPLVALAFALPLFLAMRERCLASREAAHDREGAPRRSAG